MDMGYAVKWKEDGKNYTSEIFEDAQDADDFLSTKKASNQCEAAKMYAAYTHYEEIIEDFDQ